MKPKIIFSTILIILSFILTPVVVLADDVSNHESEIEEGKSLVESNVSCEQLTDEQLEAIGEYLMEQMHPGESHEAMHQMMGMEEGTEYHKQFHVDIAKMMYCGENQGMMGMPMMNMMMGDWSIPTKENLSNNMMYSNWGVSGMGIGWIFMILFWVLIIVGVVVLIKWLVDQGKKEDRTKSAIDILKERYAKGEIDKKEFEQKKKDLS